MVGKRVDVVVIDLRYCRWRARKQEVMKEWAPESGRYVPCVAQCLVAGVFGVTKKLCCFELLLLSVSIHS